MKATFTFINGLNDFLPHYQKNKALTLEFAPHQSLKHLIESMGIPHTEIGLVLVNGLPSDIARLLHDGDQVRVQPADTPLDEQASFVLDNHLGQLATYLRMLGFDSLYRNDYQDEELAETASQQHRVLLTRDRRLLMRKVVTQGYCLHETDPQMQIAEVIRRYRLSAQIKPFQRCIKCNTPLQVVDKQSILDRLEPLTRLYYNEFRICPNCSQIYWKGSHFERMLEMINEIKRQAGPSDQPSLQADD